MRPPKIRTVPQDQAAHFVACATDRSVIRDALSGVRYSIVVGDYALIAHAAYDSVGFGATFSFESGNSLSYSWDMTQGAGFLVEGQGARRSSAGVDVDVSERWSDFIGAALVNRRRVEHETDQGRRLWSVRLEFDNGGSIVVALGDEGPTGPIYSVDNLVVIGSEAVARGYRLRPDVAMESSWG